MSDPTLILTTHDGAVVRAERSAGGAWAVERLRPDLRARCLAAGPDRAGPLYAGTNGRGVFRSPDRGRTWEPAGLEGETVTALAVSPHDPGRLYAGTKPARLFRSDDGGPTWRELEGFRRVPNRWWWFSPAEPPDLRPYLMGLAVSPTEPEVLLAGVEFGAVVRSRDGGRTWSRHRPGALRDCHSLKFHAADGDWAYEAGGTGGGASVSRDGGRTWQKAGRGLAAGYGVVCAADPARPEVWYVCVAPGPGKAYGENAEVYLYRAAGGASWEPIGWEAHPLRAAPAALVTRPGEPGHLYAGLRDGRLWHTADHGDTWAQLPLDLGGVSFSLLVL